MSEGKLAILEEMENPNFFEEKKGGASTISEYEEFQGREDYTNCPTCQGIGRVARKNLNELVALVPASDDRLKPRNDKRNLFIGGMVVLVVCGLVGGLAIFFLLPRVVMVSMRTPSRDSVIVCPQNGTEPPCTEPTNAHGAVLMNLTVPLHLDNCNFRTGEISAVDFEILFGGVIIGSNKLLKPGHVNSRSEGTFNTTIPAAVTSKINPYAVEACQPDASGPHLMVIHFEITVNVTVHDTVQQTALQQYCYINCSPAVSDITCVL
ncbi:Oidioi.mRNA.OKI2018_I69.chr1.g731.t1.cds [Oikopleura dioica]|uniref:Oidioi.mRNA.OKI2018_I69.chr1.g731.t1.cds n=1 Tax=Oikopleura dioica TaxID=34765 RepID=A0ABN7SPF2_OIKDI|nr:Oidioi.mRNA.OKI2018_I69.chr1.g731.t1.cds [Oikopleura dioica]